MVGVAVGRVLVWRGVVKGFNPLVGEIMGNASFPEGPCCGAEVVAMLAWLTSSHSWYVALLLPFFSFYIWLFVLPPTHNIPFSCCDAYAVQALGLCGLATDLLALSCIGFSQ